MSKGHRDINSHDSLNDDKEHTELKVIGAGLPRTGTLSLKTALTQLYSGKCYHMMDAMTGDQEDFDVWIKAVNGEMKSEHWRSFFQRKNYVTGVDYPVSAFWKDLMKVYPDAKVVLSTRDPKTWHSSVFNSIWQMRVLMKKSSVNLLVILLDRRNPNPSTFLSHIWNFIPDGCKLSLHDAITEGQEAAEQFFLDWETDVIRSVPPENLLVHSAKEGWGPLCKFLNVPIPDNDYPRVNDTASIQKSVRNIKIANALIFYISPICAAIGGFFYLS